MAYDAEKKFKKSPAKEKKVSPQIITKDFKDFAMTAEKRKEFQNREFAVDDLIADGLHTYIFGSSGAGKTTVLLHLGFEMVQKGYSVYFLYLDGEMGSAAAVSKEAERLGVADKYSILTDGTMADYLELFKEKIKEKADLKKKIFILDTFKFLTGDINSKTQNKEAMHFIKDICKLGATFISLGHTNKDGQKQSGTAEIEQDCDCLLRMDSVEFEGDIETTIRKGGRVRASIKPQSFSFTGGDALSVRRLDNDIDIIAKQQRAKDNYLIKIVQGALSVKEILKGDLLDLLETKTELSRRDRTKFINKYDGIEWKSRVEKNKRIYFVENDFLSQWNGLPGKNE